MREEADPRTTRAQRLRDLRSLVDGKGTRWPAIVLLAWGVVILGVWFWISIIKAVVEPRPIFDVSFLVGTVLVVGAAAWRLHFGPPAARWCIALFAGAAGTTAAAYALASIVAAPLIPMRAPLMLLTLTASGLNLGAFTKISAEANRFGATGFRRAAIKSSTLSGTVSAILLAAYNLWYGHVVLPTGTPFHLAVTAEITPGKPVAGGTAYLINVTAKNESTTPVLFLGDAFVVLAGDISPVDERQPSASGAFVCGQVLILNPSPTPTCVPPGGAPSTGEPRLLDVDRVAPGFAESWVTAATGSLFGPGSWLEPQATQTSQFVVTVPSWADVVRFEEVAGIGNADQLRRIYDEGTEYSECIKGPTYQVQYKRIVPDVAAGIASAINPVDFAFVWHPTDSGLETEVCARRGGSEDVYEPIPLGDPGMAEVLAALNLQFESTTVEIQTVH
jgi:hypothetical protein